LNAVDVIDGATNQVTTVPVGIAPEAAAVNLATNQIYVANSGSSTVTVIDGANNSTSTIPVGLTPSAVAVNPVTNMIYVAAANDGQLSVINGATGTVVAFVNVQQYPTAVAVNPLTNMIYVGNRDSSSVTVVNGITYATTNLALGQEPECLFVNTISNKIYVGTPNQMLIVIDGATNTITDFSVAAGVYGMAINPVTGEIYIPGFGLGSSGNSLGVMTEQNTQANPLTTTITPLPKNQTTSTTPEFQFVAASTFSPTAPTPQGVYYQVDSWQGAWKAAIGVNPDFSGRTNKLTAGPHVIYAFAVDGQEAGINGDGNSGQILTGSIAAYAFTVIPPGQ